MQLLTAFTFAVLSAYVTAADNKCTSIEVRKEWRTFTNEQRKAWIDAVNCLNKAPSSGKLKPPVNVASYGDMSYLIPPVNKSGTFYDEMVYAHMNLNPVIHWTGLFLPWHRTYVHEWTNALRSKCGYKGVAPYWAWEKDSGDFRGSKIWDSDPQFGLGSFSDNVADDFTLKDGALKISVAYPVPHNLRRHFIPYPLGDGSPAAVSTFTPAEIEKLLSQGNFLEFQGYIEKLSGMHGAIHLMMGGDMGGVCPAGTLGTKVCFSQPSATFSANEPMFHLHHANVDRLWALWQDKSDTNKKDFQGGSVQNRSSLDIYPAGQPPWLEKTSPVPSAGMWDERTIEQTLDTRSWPWCYTYE
ncbi:hypothetical protein CTheo_3422 [Ceratobasidium theobromae]|uniref:Tyrosinase copper-binding domain-containing protein n=1 Tax=Ceratobasidium theobromae TaxID=1582974 RepID=A0A5N5QMX1_9AGAM|nr:hypothetical protein CTheo_3422 [Ceratobasidium theobromae]